MRNRFVVLVLVACAALLGMGFLLSSSDDAQSASALTLCDMSVGSVWVPTRLPPHRVEAFSHGPRCDKAVVVLTIRAPDGSVLWVDAMPAEHLMTFAGVKSQAEMKRSLADWVSQSSPFKSSADLPPWRVGANGPVNGEFPFYTEEGIDRDSYEKTRALRAPVFCYVQGMESMACIVLQDGGMSKIGLQSFPG